MTTFKPLDTVSRRVKVIQALSREPYGTVVPYERLEELLNADREVVRGAVNDAKPKLEKDHLKAVVAVRGEGYRIAHPNEQRELAVMHQQKATRSLKKSHSKVSNIDLSRLTEGERAAVSLAAIGINMQLDYARRNDIRAERHEEMIEATQQQGDRTTAEVEDLKARLARLEARSLTLNEKD